MRSLRSVTSSEKHALEKYGRAIQDTDENKTWRMRFICWITKARHTQSQNMWYLLLFHSNNGYANAPQYYVIRTLPFLFCFQRSPPLTGGLRWASAACWSKPHCANSLSEKESFTSNFYKVVGELMLPISAAIEFFRVFFYTSAFGKFFGFIFKYFQRHAIETALGDGLLWCSERIHATVDTFV
jgi:hypothetical protein